jgi:hypothetical protein
MSALGQKRTSGSASRMSAKCQKLSHGMFCFGACERLNRLTTIRVMILLAVLNFLGGFAMIVSGIERALATHKHDPKGDWLYVGKKGAEIASP